MMGLIFVLVVGLMEYFVLMLDVCGVVVVDGESFICVDFVEV